MVDLRPIRKAVFVDRDGVLNHTEVIGGKPFAPRKCDEFNLFHDTFEQLIRLKDENFSIVVVTNQPDVGNGLTKLSELEKIHNFLINELPIDLIKVCLHPQGFGCSCRKPLPGMLFQAAVEMSISPVNSFMIGDRDSDILAGNAFGCRSIFINRSYSEGRIAVPWFETNDLKTSVDKIISSFLN